MTIRGTTVARVLLDEVDLTPYTGPPRQRLTVELAAAHTSLRHAWEALGFMAGAVERCRRCRAIRRLDDHGLLCPGPHRIDIRKELRR